MIKLRVIKPAPFQRDGMEAVVRQEFRSIANDVQADYFRTVKTWSDENKPEFNEKVNYNPLSLTLVVWTDSELYRLIEEGAKPHPIWAKEQPVMSFPETYHAKTRPRTIFSLKGGYEGDIIAVTKVNHPGFEGRQFSATIRDRWRPLLKSRMEAALNRAAIATRHSIRGKTPQILYYRTSSSTRNRGVGLLPILGPSA